ncbi:MAG: gamma-glutamyltransferase [Acidobacteria bacterium]|nr:gamma-glutamyltransferase [Acidobacteriota bacterium]
MKHVSLLVASSAVWAQSALDTSKPAAAKWPATMRPVVRGTRYAVSSMKPAGTMAAERVLRAGGNAFDAAVAGQAVLAIVDAQNNGVGSDAVLLVHDAKSGKVWSVNAEGTAPKLATIAWYKQHQGGKLPVGDTLLSGTVPGVVDAWYVLLDRWGTMSFAQVLGDAIDMAENGFPIDEKLVGSINGSKKLKKYPSSERTFFPLGRDWKAGEMATNRNLARTLRRLVEAERGAVSGGRRAGLKAARDEFYKGAIAREMAAFSEANGGLFRYEDFASYSALVEEAVSTSYRGYVMYKNPSASQGPAELFALNLLEGYDLKGMGHNTPDAIHVGIESVKLAFADRDKYLGDMEFVRIPYAALLAPPYTAARRRMIDMGKASLEYRPGSPEVLAGEPALDRPADVDYSKKEGDGGDTSYIAVVDAARNAVSFTPSLHTGFGTNVVMGDLGFAFNCRGDYYSLVPGHANALGPGRRPRSTLQGTLVTREGKPFLVTGSPGGDDQIMRTMQTFLNIVDFGMNVQQAIEAPRWSTRSFPMSHWPHTMYPGEVTVESRIPEAVRAALKQRGHKLKVGGAWSLGYNAAIVIDAATGVLHAGADPRVDAYALAW